MALIPAGYLKVVVSLGVVGVSDESFTHHGTGFLYHHPIWEKDGRTHYHPFLITNRHVIDGGVSNIRFNSASDGTLKVHSIESVTIGAWTVHPNDADVAVIPISNPGPLMEGRNPLETEIILGDVGTPSNEEVSEIVEGNGVFLLGFPLGLIGDERNYPIVRSGIIARIQGWLRGDEHTFLIDAPAFPGNSGGPVILKPENVAIKDTKPITHALLIGMVRGYIPSQDVAVSTQTGNPRIIFEENSGLAEVVPINVIKETLDLAVSSLPKSLRDPMGE